MLRLVLRYMTKYYKNWENRRRTSWQTTTTTKWFLGSLRASRAIKKLTSLMKIWLTGKNIDTPMTNVHAVFQFISTHAWQCIFKTDLVCIDCIVNDRYVCSRQCLLCPFLSLRGVGLACSSSCWPCLYVVRELRDHLHRNAIFTKSTTTRLWSWEGRFVSFSKWSFGQRSK